MICESFLEIGLCALVLVLFNPILDYVDTVNYVATAVVNHGLATMHSQLLVLACLAEPSLA